MDNITSKTYRNLTEQEKEMIANQKFTNCLTGIDWRIFVPLCFLSAWDTLSQETRVAIYIMARNRAKAQD